MIDNSERYSISLYCTLGLTCFLLLIMQKTSGLSLTMGTATPVLLVPMVVAVSCFLREWTGFLFGLFCGIGMDIFSSGSRCFNTIAMILVGAFAGLLYHYIFNRNLKSVIIGSVIFSFGFCFIRWVYLCLFAGDGSAFLMLIRYEIPSALYTSVFILPFYYFTKHLANRHLIRA